jgi:ABC-type multidrug transport system fused ATPase/permease subunit
MSVFLVQSTLFLVELLLLMTVPRMQEGRTGIIALGQTVLTGISLVTMLNMPMRDPGLGRAEELSRPFTAPTSSLRSPEDSVTLWQWMTISWMGPLINVGNKRQIHDEDVWFLPFEFQHSRLHQLFRDVQGPVWVRLLKANGPDLIFTTFLGILESVTTLSQVVFLKQVLGSLDGDEPKPRVALVYASFILMARLVAAQSSVFALWFSRRIYERSRGELITMIYEKTLTRKAFTFASGGSIADAATNTTQPITLPETSSEADEEAAVPDENEPMVPQMVEPYGFQWLLSKLRRGHRGPRPTPAPIPSASPASTGKILNLMRNDVYEVAQRFWEFSSLVTKPLNFVLSLVLIWKFLGPVSLSGLVFLVAAQLINYFLIRALLQVERERRAITDVKLQRTTQFVEAIRHLRWYDWQDAWLQQILASRQAELAKRVVSSVLSKIIYTTNTLSAYLIPVAGFWAYTTVLGKPLLAEIAFPALDLFSLLQVSLRELLELVPTLLNATVAMGRIEAFMAEPDKETEAGGLTGPKGDLQISMDDASFSWPGSDKLVLQGMTFVCQPGLTVVCGKVGVGKTALLQAVLGELDQHGGERSVPDETIGYSAQTPWLESMSIRDNILFCREYDERRYRQVLDACCLLPDLENFKAGDLFMVGENGVGLSGGQKARVALARAVYSRARILLLDDPIAALDHQTADTIIRKLFAGNGSSSLAAERLVVFVTHRVDLITPYADQVLDLLEDGTVKTIKREELETSDELRQLAAQAVAHEVAAVDEDAANAAIPDKLIEEEHRAEGGVMLSVYWQYIKAGGLVWWAALAASFVVFRLSKVLYFRFLQYWAEAYGKTPGSLLFTSYADVPQFTGLMRSSAQVQLHPAAQHTSGWRFSLDLHLPNPSTDVNPWILWFFIISLAQVVADSLSDFIMVVIVYKAGKRLFADVMRRVSNAKFRFYDVTPVGRLMNRLTSDIGAIDGQIAGQLSHTAWFGISWLSSVLVIASATPLFLVLAVVMSLIFVYIFQRFLPTSQSLRRLEMVSLSPLMSNFGALVEGLTTVRAFKAQPDFQNRIIQTTDSFQKMDHFYWSLQSWLTYRFDLLSALATFTLTMTAVATGLSAGAVGFVLAAAGEFVTATHNICRKYGELQMNFVSVERVIELLDLDQEDDADRPARKPPAAWPTYSDDITFDNVTLRYAAHLDPSLSNVSFHIPAGSTVAVTGRTGSGKSTLALALLGTLLPDAETGGAIRIGAVDVATVDKHALRRSITFVAQDPVLFPGSLRDNLDPLREHSDAECKMVLDRVLRNDAFSLESSVDAGGKNLSQGQRQLIGIGRAVLRRSPVVVLDEVCSR